MGFRIIDTEVAVKAPLRSRVIDILAERNGQMVKSDPVRAGLECLARRELDHSVLFDELCLTVS